MNEGWMVARVRPHYLSKSLDNMKRQGCEVYSPCAWLRSEKTKRPSIKPLFPGYVFVRHPDKQWIFLLGTFGVLSVIMKTEQLPAEVPDKEIARLREREGDDGLIRFESSEFAIGEHVRVEKGVVSLDAIVEEMSGRDRVFVLMEFLGALQRVEVEVRDIHK